MNPIHPLRSSILLYLLLAPAAFWKCLGGRAYFDNDLLAFFVPFRAFLRDRLALGDFPLWNPYHLGGQPFFADLQNMMLYPFHLLTLPFSLAAGLTAFFVLHFFWAATGMHLWLRALGLGAGACRIGALLFAASGFFWMELIHPPVLAAFAWLPWVFLTVGRFAGSPRPMTGFWAGLSLAMLFLAGSLQVFLGGFYGALAYGVFRVWRRMKALPSPSPLPQGERDRRKDLLLGAALFLWGALPLLAQFIPTLEFSSLSTRGTTEAGGTEAHARLSMHPGSLHQFLLPRFLKNGDEEMAEAVQSTDPERNFWGALGYLGVWAPLLALAAFTRRERSIPWFLAGLGAVSLALCLGKYLPLYRIFHDWVPGFSLLKVPFRYSYLYVLALSGLAAFGWEGWKAAMAGKTRAGWLAAALAWALVLCLAALWRPGNNWIELLALGIGIAAFAAWAFPAGPWGRYAAPLFLAALLGPLALHGWNLYVPGAASNFDFRGNSGALSTLRERTASGRLLFFGNGLLYPVRMEEKTFVLNYPQNAASALGLKNFGGYNPLALRAKKDLAVLPLETAVKMGAIRGLLSMDPDLDIPGFRRKPLPPFHLYEWEKELPHAFVPVTWDYVPEAAERLRRLSAPSFDPYREAVLSGDIDPGPESTPGDPRPNGLRYELVTDGTDQQVFRLELDRAGLVVFAETMFPGWKARIDGEPAPVLTADHALRALVVPAGPHWVEFRFEPFWWPWVLPGLAAWALLTLAGLVLFGPRNPLLAGLKGLQRLLGGSGLGRVKVLRALYDSVYGLLKPRQARVQGHVMWLDERDSLELATREVYEPGVTEVFKREIRAGQTVLDLGANIGYFTLLAARLVGPKGRVIAFEPDPVNFGLLKRNIKDNGYRNVILERAAVCDRTGKTALFLNESNRGDHRLFASAGDARRKVPVRSVKLDGFLKELDRRVHFIKMDVQGSEFLALSGMKGLLRGNRKLKLVTEFEPGNLRQCGADPLAYLAALKKAGFKLFVIPEGGDPPRPAPDAKGLLRLCERPPGYVNLYCVKD